MITRKCCDVVQPQGSWQRFWGFIDSTIQPAICIQHFAFVFRASARHLLTFAPLFQISLLVLLWSTRCTHCRHPFGMRIITGLLSGGRFLSKYVILLHCMHNHPTQRLSFSLCVSVCLCLCVTPPPPPPPVPHELPMYIGQRHHCQAALMHAASAGNVAPGPICSSCAISPGCKGSRPIRSTRGRGQ